MSSIQPQPEQAGITADLGALPRPLLGMKHLATLVPASTAAWFRAKFRNCRAFILPLNHSCAI